MFTGGFVKSCAAIAGRFIPLAWIALELTGCALVGPRISVREAVDVVISASMEASALADRRAPQSLPRLAVKNVCVELNVQVTVAEFLPAVQSGLQRRGVASRVYAPGTAPYGCDAVLNYEATRDWDTRLASVEALPYMSFARITLRRDGQLLAAATYGVRGLGFDKWASTSAKIEPMLDTLLAGGQ